MIHKIFNIVFNVLDRMGYELSLRKKHVDADISLYSAYPAESIEKKRFYNIGAGSFSHPCWTNIDHASKHYEKIQKHGFIEYDLMQMQQMPIADNTAEIVYSSHTIEHVSDRAVKNMLKESFRILKPGGVIRLTTPDAELDYQAYKRNDRLYYYWIEWYSKNGTWENNYKCPLSKASTHQIFLHHHASQLCEINKDDTPLHKYSDKEIEEAFLRNPSAQTIDYFTQQCKFNPAYPGNHINWWTHDKIATFLKEAGFVQPYRSGWGQSSVPVLRDTNYFDNTHPKISLYVEAQK